MRGRRSRKPSSEGLEPYPCEAARSQPIVRKMTEPAPEEKKGLMRMTMENMIAKAREYWELQAGEYTIRWSLYENSQLGATALKRAPPDIAAQHTKITTSTRFYVA